MIPRRAAWGAIRRAPPAVTAPGHVLNRFCFGVVRLCAYGNSPVGRSTLQIGIRDTGKDRHIRRIIMACMIWVARPARSDADRILDVRGRVSEFEPRTPTLARALTLGGRPATQSRIARRICASLPAGPIRGIRGTQRVAMKNSLGKASNTVPSSIGG